MMIADEFSADNGALTPKNAIRSTNSTHKLKQRPYR